MPAFPLQTSALLSVLDAVDRMQGKLGQFPPLCTRKLLHQICKLRKQKAQIFSLHRKKTSIYDPLIPSSICKARLILYIRTRRADIGLGKKDIDCVFGTFADKLKIIT